MDGWRCLGTAMVASVLSAFAPHAENVAAADAQALLREGVGLTRTCLLPDADWPQARLSSNFDRCNEALQAFVRATQLSKDVKTAEAASLSLTKVNANLAVTALPIARHYVETGDRKPALAFLRVTCISVDAVSSFEALKPEQAAAMKSAAEEADRLLRSYQTNCKAIVAAD